MDNIVLKENKEYITLSQLLKVVGFTQTGGEAKIFLNEHKDKIYVNDVLENRRKKKLYSGYIIKILDKTIIINN